MKYEISIVLFHRALDIPDTYCFCNFSKIAFQFFVWFIFEQLMTKLRWSLFQLNLLKKKIVNLIMYWNHESELICLSVISFVLRFAFLLSSVHGFPLYYSMESLLPRLVVEVFISTSMGWWSVNRTSFPIGSSFFLLTSFISQLQWF